jgi:ribonuclease D
VRASKKPESAELVADAQALTRLVSRLHKAAHIAFDTESASFHRYVDRVYLIQLSTEQETALVDPVALDVLTEIGTILEDPQIEIVFHDADYDLRVLDRDYGFRAQNLFDTRVAAQLAGEAAVGLSSLLQKHLGIALNKKFQRADWSVRPLSADMLAYAADDTRHLLALRDILTARLEDLGRLHWAQEEFVRLEEIRWTGRKREDEDGYQRIRGAGTLTRRQLAVLREVHQWRETTARNSDRAPFRILGNPSLVDIARGAPRSMRALGQVSGVTSQILRRHGKALLNAVSVGAGVPNDALPMIKRTRAPTPDAGYEERLDRLKVLRDACARETALDPGLVCPNGTLQAIARAAPESLDQLSEVSVLRVWQREVLGGRAILAAVGAD